MEIYKDPNASVDDRVANLLSLMTLEEKIGQVGQTPMLEYEENREEYLQGVREGRYGSRILANTAWAGNCMEKPVNTEEINEIHKTALEESRLGIPLIFARDVIYGQETVLPIPLAQASSWNPQLVEESYTCVAREAAAMGIDWTFAPMMDVARDPRWGRVIETNGEDPHLTAEFAKAAIRGFQGGDVADSERLVACAKHFCAYGGSQGGRDYDTTEFSENTLQNTILPPFKAAVDEGVETLMSGFNDLGGEPVSGSKRLIRGWLKEENGFAGTVVSDWGSIADLAYFGVAEDGADSARMAIEAGVDLAMTNEHYQDHMQELVESGKVSMDVLDEAVARILRTKFRCGLFDNPYVDNGLKTQVLRRDDHVEKALQLAVESLVLLKNNDGVLPLEKPAKGGKTIAVVGPHAHSKRQHLGSWCLDGKLEDVTSIYEGIRAAAPEANIITEDAAFADEMMEAARWADIVVLCIGESHRRTGEARNISDLQLPAGQEELVESLAKSGKPLIVVQCTGRPVPSPAVELYADALLYAWQGGTEVGHAVAKVLFGDESPSGKLPISVPRNTGQIPIYYSQKKLGKMRDFLDYKPYKDIEATPLYPFGFGLSYAEFEYSELAIDKAEISAGEQAVVSVKVTNKGAVKAKEIVQMYVHDHVSSTTRPTHELKGFHKLELDAGESIVVSFTVGEEELAFFGAKQRFEAEKGKFSIIVGADCNATDRVDLELV
ncbi:glycoside hydrolase family 3 C-terminal domain-containing protein [Persicirhabdus sediminis]|uniref:beta-glucosidase n=2 Tax=Persicirhabdus sediminis TaxID=454144 RepID=A0A8J7MH10_9BACT|nr:glycoside hydrolase family 3 N-terminal domain-containing protein [Persicirhabdus sediminis]MBK1792800.1 glycoside hydrolase family 3 C-terminal domain-containing protein [Persicirhabdus sediminis]